MAFERFTKIGKSFVPRVSIWSRGQVGFSVGAINRYKLEQFDYVVFMYDPDERKIGFMFTSDGNEAGAVKLNKRETGITVGAKSFLDYYDIGYSETAQYTMKHDKEHDLYVISLDENEKPEENEDNPEAEQDNQ